jgi:hypothetical protein
MNINVEQDFLKLNGSQNLIAPILYNKPTICDKSIPEEIKFPRIVETPDVKGIEVESVKVEKRPRTEDYYTRLIPIDKIKARIDSPLPKLNLIHVRDDTKSRRLVKKINSFFSKDIEKSFALNVPEKPVFILSNERVTEFQFNPVYHSLPFMQILPLLIFGNVKAKITAAHINLDIKMPFEVMKERLRVGNKSCLEKYSPGTYYEKFDRKTGREAYHPRSTEYLGKNNKVVLYDSGAKHGLGEDFSRVEIRINQSKRLKYPDLEDFNSLIGIKPFNNIILPLEFREISKTNQDHIDFFNDIMIKKKMTFKETLSFIRMSDKSKADAISRAFRLRDGPCFCFDVVYRMNFRMISHSRLKPSEIKFLATLNTIFKPPPSST